MQQITRGAPVMFLVATLGVLLGMHTALSQEPTQLPIANAGMDREVFLRPEQNTLEVTLDGSASRDPDGGEIQQYIWRGTPRPDNVARPTVRLAAGTHVFALQVIDDDNEISTEATVVITVTPLQRPVASAGENQTFILGPEQATVEVTLQGTDSDDPDGTIVEYRWMGTPDPEDSVSPVVTLGPGRHTFTLVVVDNDGLSSAQDRVVIEVFAVTIITPQDGNVVAGNAVAVGAAVVLDDAVSARFQFRLAGTSEFTNIDGATTAQPFVVPWDTTALADGPYELGAMVNRGAANTLPSPLITVTINNTNPATADLVENVGSKLQAIQSDVDSTVLTADRVVVEIPAGALANDDDLRLDIVDPASIADLPGEAAVPLLDLRLASGADTFTTPITLRIPYEERNQDGVVDDTDIPEAALTMWFFDSLAEEWVRLVNANVDPVANVVTAMVDHLTLFGVFQAPLRITAGPQNPTTTRTIAESVADLEVLQIELATGAETILINTLTFTLADPLGEVTAITSLQANLLLDANGNGQPDTGEQILASQTLTNVVGTHTLTLTPPLSLPPDSTTHVLVTLDINTSPGSTRTASSVLPLPLSRSTRSALVLGLPVLALLLWPSRGRRAARYGTRLFLFLACGALVLTNCGGDEKSNQQASEPFTFTIGLPVNGINGQGEVSGQLSAPATAIRGLTVTVTP